MLIPMHVLAYNVHEIVKLISFSIDICVMSYELDVKFLEFQCEELDVDYGITKIIYDEWFPLLTNAHGTMGADFDKEFVLNWKKHQLKIHRNHFLFG